MFENTPFYQNQNMNPYYNPNFQQQQRQPQNYNQMNPYQQVNTQFTNQPQNQQQMIPSGLKGRVVTNVEEVKAILIEADGNTHYFPCPAQNCIYTKTIDMNAQSIINVYTLGQNELPVYADTNSVKILENRIISLENYIKGGMTNDKSNANNGNDEPTKG